MCRDQQLVWQSRTGTAVLFCVSFALHVGFCTQPWVTSPLLFEGPLSAYSMPCPRSVAARLSAGLC